MNSSLIVFFISLVLGGTAIAIPRNITTECRVTEGKDPMGTVYKIQNPYGGGKSFIHKTKNGHTISILVMIEFNQNNKAFLDMTLLVSKSQEIGLLQTVSRGLSEDRNRSNGVVLVFYTNKTGQLENSISVGCTL